MIRVLENEFLKVSVSDHGAELISILDKEKDREVIWQADEAYWKRHAPVLFPNVGRHYGDAYRINGQEYPSKQHGFARDTEFTCVDITADSVTHQIRSDEATREVYPFDFVLRIRHVLSGRKVTVCWKVANNSYETMYFTIGGHPAFRVPVLPDTVQSDYRLVFPGAESLSYFLLDPASGTADTSVAYTLPLTQGSCSIAPHMFDRDALIFDEQIYKAGILLPDGSPYVEISCEGFPNFGVWSVPRAPFVCLEPWCGRCDDRGYDGDLSGKPYINVLSPDEMFEKSYSIHIF